MIRRADKDINFDDTLRQGCCCRVLMQLIGRRRRSGSPDDLRVIADGTPTTFPASEVSAAAGRAGQDSNGRQQY